MLRGRSDVLVALSLLLCLGLFSPRPVSAEPCFNDSWVEIPSVGLLNPFNMFASNFSDCKMKCIADTRCVGIAWNPTPSSANCSFNFALANSTNSGINYTIRPAPPSTYYSLLRNYSNCGFQENSCSFSWKGVTDMHGFGGVDSNRSNLNDCIKLCQETISCRQVDWNQQDATCWISNSTDPPGTQPNITHFARNCSNPMSTTLKPSTIGPSTTPSTTTPTTTIPTTILTTTTLPTIPSTSTTPSAACNSVRCPNEGVCNVNSTGQAVCVCNRGCTTEYAPVCGSDGKTYSNGCQLMMATCQNNGAITMAYDGACPPACNSFRCPNEGICNVNSTGQAVCVCNRVCTKDYAPVCGSDGTTYGNGCGLRVATCERNGSITKAQEGECPPGPVPSMQPSEYAYYPQAIKPAYIVLAGLGGGCILLVITAVVILCLYPLHKNLKYSTNSTVTTVHTHQPYAADNNSYVDGASDQPERIDMDEMPEGEVKTYYNAEEVN